MKRLLILFSFICIFHAFIVRSQTITTDNEDAPIIIVDPKKKDEDAKKLREELQKKEKELQNLILERNSLIKDNNFQKQKVDSLENKINDLSKKVVSLRKKADEAKAEAEQATLEKEKVLAQLQEMRKKHYWYDDKIALAYYITKANKQPMYCFIDTSGYKVVKLGEWDKVEDMFGKKYIGYAKVIKNDTVYLLDTGGNKYKYSVYLNEGTEALDLSDRDYSCRPYPYSSMCLNDVFNDYDDRFGSMRKKIVVLNLQNTKLTEFSPEKDEFISLRYLDLSNNSLRRIGDIKNIPDLEYLILRNNNIEQLPKFNSLKKLIYLDISKNKFKKKKETVESFIDNGITKLTLVVDESQKKELLQIDDKMKKAEWKIIISDTKK